jgi:hypothetical protein
MTLTFKKRITTIIFLSLFSTMVIVSCGKLGKKEEHPAGEHPKDSTEHPSDSTEHPADSTEHPVEHPKDSTKNN